MSTRPNVNRQCIFDLSRRAFLATAGGTLASAAAFGLVTPAQAEKRHPTRGGTLRFATRGDVTGLDPHRNILYPACVASKTPLSFIEPASGYPG